MEAATQCAPVSRDQRGQRGDRSVLAAVWAAPPSPPGSPNDNPRCHSPDHRVRRPRRYYLDNWYHSRNCRCDPGVAWHDRPRHRRPPALLLSVRHWPNCRTGARLTRAPRCHAGRPFFFGPGRRYLPAAAATAGRCDAPPERNMACGVLCRRRDGGPGRGAGAASRPRARARRAGRRARGRAGQSRRSRDGRRRQPRARASARPRRSRRGAGRRR